MAIPVQNIYYLLCYAWDQFAPKQLEKMASVKATSFVSASHPMSHRSASRQTGI